MSGQDHFVSVIMGAYNCADTIGEAIDCIVRQTFQNWELIIADDGSSDDTYEVVASYAKRYPEKIRLLKNETNRGLNYTLNRCLAQARGDLIARMDGDDICDPKRFEIEITALDENPDIDIVSTDMEFFDAQGTWGVIRHPERPKPQDFIKESPFCHAPCMVRKSAYDAVGGYSEDPKTLRVEDYDLWIRMYAAGLRGMNIHLPLYAMRDDRNAYKRRKFIYRINEAYVKKTAIRKLGLPAVNYVLALRPVIVGLLPEAVYRRLHRKRLGHS